MKYWGEDEWKTLYKKDINVWPISDSEIVVSINIKWDKSIPIVINSVDHPEAFKFFEEFLSD